MKRRSTKEVPAHRGAAQQRLMEEEQTHSAPSVLPTDSGEWTVPVGPAVRRARGVSRPLVVYRGACRQMAVTVRPSDGRRADSHFTHRINVLLFLHSRYSGLSENSFTCTELLSSGQGETVQPKIQNPFSPSEQFVMENKRVRRSGIQPSISPDIL